MSGGANSARAMAQQALKLKAVSQLRQVIRTSSSNKTTVGNFGKDLLVVLRYLPTTVFNKIQNMSQTGPTGGGKDKGPDDGNKPPIVGDGIEDTTDLMPSNAPEPEKPSKLDKTPVKSELSPKFLEPAGAPKGVDPPIEPDPFILPLDETHLNWKNLEVRTRYLVSVLQKTAGVAPARELVHNVESLYGHMSQYYETRNIAVAAGGIKVLNKIVKLHPNETTMVNRAREILAILGQNPPLKGRGIRILSIDGGGVRGLVAIEVLRLLEKHTGKRTYELFDYICGVSTGSILGFLVGAHRKTLDEAEALYKEMSREIFNQNSWTGTASLLWYHSYYHTGTFERILKTHIGDIDLISLARDTELPRVSAVSTLVSHERVTPYVFRTYAPAVGVPSRYPGGCQYKMWEAVRASAAAPTYFEEIKLGKHIHQDGGVMVNNPTSVAISEAKSLWPGYGIQCVVSLGTGITLSSRADPNLGSLDDTKETEPKDPQYSTWKGKFKKVLDSATDTESVHFTLKELLPPNIYFRFNPYLRDVVGLDESKPEKLEQIQAETREYLMRNCERVDYLGDVLNKKKTVSGKVSDWWYY